MKNLKIVLVVLFIGFLFIPLDSTAVSGDEYLWSGGLSGFGTAIGGVGVKYDYSKKVAFHGVIGSGLGAQGRYNINSERYWDLYLGGYCGFRFNEEDNDALVLGGSVGFDIDLRVLADGMPPLSFGLEFGAGSNGFGIGGALHWNF